MKERGDTINEVEVLRKAVLESWTLTYQREKAYERALEAAEVRWAKRRPRFTRYKVEKKEATVEYGGRWYQVELPAPEERVWVPFETLLRQFEGAVRREGRT